jgi:hypothetical protein
MNQRGATNPEVWFDSDSVDPSVPPRGGRGNIQQTDVEDSKSTFDTNKLYYQVAGQVISNAKNQAGGFLNLYANIDLIRPYFDVDLRMVLHRLKLSMLPKPSPEILNSGTPDLYGPVMLVFTLVAILLVGMKLSNTKVEEGTLMGTSFAVCFSYWIVGSLVYRFTAYICSMELTFLEALSVTGYALFGYCLTLAFRIVFPSLALIALIIFGSLSAATLAGMFYGQIRPKNRSHALFAAITIFASHLLFLLYIHYAYASVYEAAAAAFD